MRFAPTTCTFVPILLLAYTSTAYAAASNLRGSSITATRYVNAIDLQTSSFSEPPCNLKESFACEQSGFVQDGDESFISDADDDDNYILKCLRHPDSSYWEHHHQYEQGINSNSCSSYDNINGAEHCTYDFQNAALNNDLFANAIANCAIKGGDLYAFDGTISCADGSSYTFVYEVLECYTSCDPASATFTIKSGWTADAFLTNLGLEKKGCKWLDITAFDATDTRLVDQVPII